MAEPEDVIAEGALVATRLARKLWSRHAPGHRPGPPTLQDLRRRLELFTAAIIPEAPGIGVADPPAPQSLLARLAHRRHAHLRSDTPLSTTDGARVQLPASLPGLSATDVPARYRLLALEQAARAARGTPGAAPSGDRLVRDLYYLSESAAVDAGLVRLMPQIADPIRAARRQDRAARALPSRPSPREHAVGQLRDGLLAADPASPPPPFTPTTCPADSLWWARAHARLLRDLPGPYRGIAPTPLWGELGVPEETPAILDGAPGPGPEAPPPGRTRRLPRRPAVREAEDGEDDPDPGTWIVRTDDLQEKAEDPAGLHRPADRDDHADPGELAEDLSELPEARLVRSDGPVREVLEGETPIPHAALAGGPATGPGICYPEWDWRSARYRVRGAVVRERPAPAGPAAWVEQMLQRHGALIRGIRRDFEQLRPRRAVLRRQPDGADLDVDALVRAYGDVRGGGAADDRFYLDTRPVRRDVAISLLVDVSASTDGWVTGDRRIIDVEKEALVVVGEALAALGDPHAILAFSGEGPGRVDIQVLKGFREPARTGDCRARIAGLEPEGYTRTGAALRHATAGLAACPARHRLILLLSDGRPNDLDQYEGRYGIEDTRMAVTEARLQGMHCFCLTVDREAPRYATRIFGRDFGVLSRPERLPGVLIQLLRDLVRR